MLEADSAPLTIGLAVSLLLLAPFAGCLETIGEATQDAVTDRDPDDSSESEAEEAQEAETDSQDEESESIQEGDIAETYESAFSSVEPGSDSIERVSLDIHADPLDSEEVFDVGLYWNARNKVAVMHFENGTPTDDANLQSDGMDVLLFGTVHKTSFLGVPPHLMAHYNESESWDDDTFNLSGLGSVSNDGDSSGSDFDFSSLLDEMDDLPSEAAITWDTITYEGKRAHEIQIEHENETDTIDMRAVVATGSELPLLLEGTFENETEEATYLEMAFAYGDDADHEYADDLLRMEAMALTTDDEGDGLASGGLNETQNLTVLPSQNPGMIALEEVEVHLQSSAAGSSKHPTSELVLPAEDGRVVTANATLVYDDADGDEAVSPGDEIRFTPHTEDARSWSVNLHDEKTEMYVAPGPGLVIAGLAAGLAVLLRRSKP